MDRYRNELLRAMLHGGLLGMQLGIFVFVLLAIHRSLSEPTVLVAVPKGNEPPAADPKPKPRVHRKPSGS